MRPRKNIEIVTRNEVGHLLIENFNPNADGMLNAVAYADTSAGRLMVRLPVTQEMIDDLPAEWFDDHLREAMNTMIATRDELLRYRVSKLRERAALREAGGI